MTPNELKIGMKADVFIYYEKIPEGYQKDFNPVLRGLLNEFNPIQEGVLKSPTPSKMPKITPNELKIGMKADIFNY